MIRETLEIPVYESHRYQYIRIKDVKGYNKLELERWVFGRFQPLIVSEEEGDIQDAVFLDDYYEFLKYLEGKKAKVN